MEHHHFDPVSLQTIYYDDYIQLSKHFPKWNEIEKQIVIKCFITLEQRFFNHLSMNAEERYWDPFIIKASGNIKLGTKLAISIQPPHQQSMNFKPTVREYLPLQSLEWLGKFVIAGLFDGRHRFEIQPQMDGSCIFIQEETFSGILVPFINLENTKKGFEMMNIAIKTLAEK